MQLQFLSRLSLPVFTGTRIEGEDCNTLKVAIIDACTGKTVSYGNESSAAVEIVVLEGDFDNNEDNNWTPEEFTNNIVKQRQGKMNLLTGNALLNLKEGVGLVGDLSFTDNSSWTRSRKFRLGAQVLDKCDGDRVREAKSESFVVRDHRGELYKKHHPPYLSDEVWRLEKIGKDGAFHKRLNKEKIKTVKDFLAFSYLDPAKLRNILGSGMSIKMWEVVVEHARRCTVDDKKLYLYCPPSLNRDGVVFNIVGQVLGVLSDRKYVVADSLSEFEKVDAHNLVISAFQHQEEIVAYDDEASLRAGTCSISEDIYPLDPENSKIRTSHKKGRFDYPQMSALSPDVSVMPTIFPSEGVDSLDEYGLNSMETEELGFDHDPQLSLPNETLICDSGSLKGHHDEDMRYFGTSSSQVDLQRAVDGFLFPHSAIGKAQRRWKIVYSVLKWFSLMLEIRRRVIVKCMNPG
ncbi:calmodulin-binding protein 60 A-like isoform X2 [Bidens hawaiensis]